MENRLHKSRSNRVLAGVCGGLGEYFDIDPTFVRLLFVLLVFFHGIGILAYIVLWVILPRESSADLPPRDVMRENFRGMRYDAEQFGQQFRSGPSDAPVGPTAEAAAEPVPTTSADAEPGAEYTRPLDTTGAIEPARPIYDAEPVPPRSTANRQVLAGAVLVILGIMFLLDNLHLFWWFSWGQTWPLILVAIGAWLLYDRGRTRRL